MEPKCTVDAWLRQLEPEENETPIVGRAFQMSLAGQGGKEIAKALNKDGIRTRSGKHWYKTIINNML